MKNYNILYTVLIIVLLVGCNQVAMAGLTPRTVGLGDEFATLTGSEALYGNPAAVNVTDDVFNLEINLATGLWNNLLKNDYISEEQKDNLLGKLNDTGFIINTQGNLGGKLTIGPLTGFTDVKQLAMVRLSTDLASLLLKGNEIGKEYSLEETAGVGAFYLDTGVNLSIKLMENKEANRKIYMGVTYHYLTGVIGKGTGSGSFQIGYNQDDEPTIIGNSGEFTLMYSDVDENLNLAQGSAFDVGVYTQLNETYSLGLSLMNVGGSLLVDEARYYKYGFLYEDLDNDGVKEWDFSSEPEEGMVPGGFELKLPLITRLGGKMQVTKSLSLLANYTNTYYPEEVFGSTLIDHKFAVASECTLLKILPLRLGANYSTMKNDLELTAGMGLHLGPLKADVGVSDLTGFFNQAGGVTGALSARIEF